MVLTKNYYKQDWVRNINAEPEEINPNFVAGGACNTAVKWELVYIDEEKTQMKLTISGNGEMIDFYETEDAPWYSRGLNAKAVVIADTVTSVGKE